MRMSRDAVLAAMSKHSLPLIGSQTELHGVSLDSRCVAAGTIFFCVRGEHSDGHDFAESAVAAGAGMIVAAHDLPELHAACIRSGTSLVLVPEPVQALGELAHAWRWCAAKNGVKVIGITGTAGKTTVKEVLAAVLSEQGATAKNHLNYNNQIGLPQSILAANGDEAFWVMELGISQAHDMDELGAVLEPDLAIVVNAGAGHTEGLGADVARHKARLLAWLAPHGQALVCAEYPALVHEADLVCHERTDIALSLCGTAGSAVRGPHACRAAYIEALAPDTANKGQVQGRYQVFTADERYELLAPFQGQYGAENISLIAATARLCGLSCEQLAQGLQAAILPAQRFSCTRHKNWLVVDDSYNANPLSFARMLESVADMAKREGGELVCVLGEMRELGSLAQAEHEELGRRIAASKAQRVLWCGGQAESVKYGLKLAGFVGEFFVFNASDELETHASLWVQQGGVILFKGSRGNHLETGVARFVTMVESRHAV